MMETSVAGGAISVLGLLLDVKPIFAMELLYWLSFAMLYILSKSAAIYFHIWFESGRKLALMIASHDNDPAICAVSCKTVILITQGQASGKIFEQLKTADTLTKLLEAIEKHWRNLLTAERIEYAANLLPMCQVLAMLVSVNERAECRGAVRNLACDILKEYRDVPSGQSEVVAQVVDSALSILEYLVVRSGKLTFSAANNTYNGTPTADEMVGLTNLLNGLVDDREFCMSIKMILLDCSLSTAGQVCRLLHCLFHVDRLCFDAASNQNQSNRVAKKIFSSPDLGLSDLLRLLKRKTLKLPVGDLRNKDSVVAAALNCLCGIVGTLRFVLPALHPPANPNQQSNATADVSLSNSLTSLGHWAMKYKVVLVASTEAKQLLEVLVDDFAWMLGCAYDAPHWPQSSAALQNLLAAIKLETDKRKEQAAAPPVRLESHLFKYWVEDPDKALVKAFYESRGSPPECDEKLIAIIKQSGKIEDSQKMTVRIQEEWRDLPKRIRAVLSNEDVDKNDKYKAIRDYVDKDPAFFKRFEETQHAVNDLNRNSLPSKVVVEPEPVHVVLPSQSNKFIKWVADPDRALIKAFYESRGNPPGCDENLIDKIRLTGNIENSQRMTERIKEKWKELPKRIRAVLRNEAMDRNDKYEAIRDYVKKDRTFFEDLVELKMN